MYTVIQTYKQMRIGFGCKPFIIILMQSGWLSSPFLTIFFVSLSLSLYLFGKNFHSAKQEN